MLRAVAHVGFRAGLACKHGRGVISWLHQQPDQQTQNSFTCSWFLSLGYTGQHRSSNAAYFQMSDNFQNRK